MTEFGAGRGALPHIAILGGGQLAKMMVQQARRLGFTLSVLDPDPEAPALGLANRSVVAPFDDAEKVAWLVRGVDAVTFDLENVAIETLRGLEASGVRFGPSLDLLEVVQDKLLQKERLAAAGLPVPAYHAVEGDWSEGPLPLEPPFFLKLRRSGYDGRGVRRIRSREELADAWSEPSLLEAQVDLRREISVIVARNAAGQTAVYDPVVMVFDGERHQLDYLLAPGPIEDLAFPRARELAVATAETLGAIGVLAVELFEDRDGRIWINEVAPRPHNSGHHTIEACLTDQFEQHLRGALGLPLGATDQVRPAATANLIAGGETRGPVAVSGLHEVAALPGVALHLYGKTVSVPGRKMGHVTALHPDLDRARDLVLRARDTIRIHPRSS